MVYVGGEAGSWSSSPRRDGRVPVSPARAPVVPRLDLYHCSGLRRWLRGPTPPRPTRHGR
jgi:hypothetical protein